MADEDKNNQNPDDAGADRTGDQNGNNGGAGNPPNEDYPEGLGDAGKRAIDRMKQERDDALRAKREAEQKLTDSQKPPNDDSGRNGGKNGKDDKVSDEGKQSETKSPDEIRDEVTAAVTAQNDARVLRSEVKRLAEGKLADASDALRFLDVTDMKPDPATGDFDSAAITSKLDQLVKDRPYLAKGVKFEGGADSGQRGDEAAKGQLAREDLKNMSPADIVKAGKEGRLHDLRTGKT